MDLRIILGAYVLLMVVFIFKTENAAMNRSNIIDAIFLYSLDCLGSEKQRGVCYDDMESFDKTLFRLWDWGYERILPPEKYEILKPYLQLLKEAQHEKTQ